MQSTNRTTKVLIMTATIALLAGAVGSAFAANKDTTWQKNHPRREQVNQRLANQNVRIQNKVKSGEITKTQATALHQQDHAIRQEERTMASNDGGHITKTDQKALNQQETAISTRIGK